MPTTRSAGKQTKLDDFEDGATIKPRPGKRKATQDAKAAVAQPKPSKRPKPNTSAKRASGTDKPSTTKSSGKKSKTDTKNAKQAQLASDDINDLEKPIVINRSPVLQLWGAVVAQFLYPEESWSVCLSIGGAIASLCAISKGKSVGAIEPKDKTEQEEKKHKNSKEKAKQGAREVEVMGFPLHLKGDAAVLSGKPKPMNEGTITGKFGGQDRYQRTKSAMEEALKSWNGDKDELDKKAFHMYEKFRPNVAKGMSGWGKKGELNLHKVSKTIKG